MLKIYEMDIMRSSVEVRVGKGYRRVKFDGGIIAGAHRIPATFCTDDEELQGAIEGMRMFRSGEIRLRVGERVDDPGNGDSGVDGDKVFAEVRNTQAAREILLERFGVELSVEAGTPEVVAKGKELGLIFPEWVSYNK